MFDFTKDFIKKSLDLNLTNTISNNCALDAQFSNKVKDIKQGLYVCIFSNPNRDFDIRDNNKNKSTVIRAGGASVKFGKFEAPRKIGEYIPSGLIYRMRTNYKHLHINDPTEKKMFAESIKNIFVFDLTQKKISLAEHTLTNTPAALEKMWNMAVDDYITTKGYCTGPQKMRSEWRNIKPAIANNDSMVAALKLKLEDLEKQLLRLCG